ncbi:C4b-binding protein alpha chain-like [Pangshura tecta]
MMPFSFPSAITCSPPPNITNGMHNGSNVEIFVYNSSVTYKCDHNFLLIGEASIHCTTKDNINGVWNGSAPECKEPGFDTRIGIPGISSNIAIAIAIAVGAIAVIAVIAIGK